MTLAIAIPGTLAGGAALRWLYLYARARTGVLELDGYGIRGRIVWEAMRTWELRRLHVLKLVRACLAITRQESRGNPDHFVGDTSATTGPSIGPMQVSRGTAEDLRLTADNTSYDEWVGRSADVAFGIHAGVSVFAHKLETANGVITGVDGALRRYNGSGPAARGYAEEVEAWADSIWGEGCLR